MLVRKSPLQSLIFPQSCRVAIAHYSPDPNDCVIIQKDLCDSGCMSALAISQRLTHSGISGKYLDGTTDTVRTLYFGTPTDGQRRAFTRLLQGHIAIDTAVLPTGTFAV